MQDGVPRAPAWLLGALVLLQAGCSGASLHSLKYFYTAVFEPGQGPPRFVAVGYVDEQPFVQYDSDGRRLLPRASWMRKVDKEDPQYWDKETENLKRWEQGFRVNLGILRQRYNQSGGIHTVQHMYGCELSEDGHRGGYRQYGYDGRDFIAFDMKTLTWTAAVVPAQRSKRKWDAEAGNNVYRRAYLEKTCPEWLQKYLDYGKETLLRKERPVVKVTRKDSHEGLETLLCRAHGFYPKEIDITWRRDGEVRQGDTFRGVVSPNADGTYYTWLSIEVDPQERSHYRCHVEHDGLQEPLAVAVEESAWKTVGVSVGGVLVLLVVLLVAGVYFYTTASVQSDNSSKVSDQGSDSSVRGSAGQVSDCGSPASMGRVGGWLDFTDV